MPGYELIGREELDELKHLFKSSGILFRHSFDNLRNNVYKVRDFEKEFAQRMNVPYALGVSSGTAALRVALAALGISDGDEVITQSFTFVATVESIIESRAVPVVTEVDSTLNMDPDDLERKISKNTKAIIVVHMLGTPARLKEIKEIADKHSIPIIEDTAWGCGGYYDDISLGTYGDIGTYSFDFAKTITTGEGGMIVFKNEEYYKKAAAWHDHGHENNPSLPRWEDSRSSSGFNFRMNEMQGAVGISQLKKLDRVVLEQRKNAKLVREALSSFPIRLREVPDNSYETSDAQVFFTETPEQARQCRDELVSEGIGTKILPEAISWHFAGCWDHMPELFIKHGRDLNNAFLSSKEILDISVALPISVFMPEDFTGKIRKALSRVF